jgi:hypothetical protein
MAGPPIVREPNLRVTWQGYTQWGRTIYFASDDGRQGVMWQPDPMAPFMYKVSDGETGVVPLDTIQSPQQQMPAYQPAPAYSPQQPGMRTVGCAFGLYC